METHGIATQKTGGMLAVTSLAPSMTPLERFLAQEMKDLAHLPKSSVTWEEETMSGAGGPMSGT